MYRADQFFYFSRIMSVLPLHQHYHAAMVHPGLSSMASSKALVCPLRPCKEPQPFRRAIINRGCRPARCEVRQAEVQCRRYAQWPCTVMRITALPWPGHTCSLLAPHAQAGRVTIPQRLNNVPHLRETRQFFYQDACAAVRKGVSAGERLLSVK